MVSAPDAATFRNLSEKHYERTVSLRRQLHTHPELSWQEHLTARLVADTLSAMDIEVYTGIAGTGVVGILRCAEPDSRCVALRADMDALPIQENNAAAYKSVVQGVMHACGHDVHTANLLATASILASLRHSLTGTFKFIFQPSEEQLPSGADAMIKAGVLQNPNVEKIIALHVSPELETGTYGFCPGNFMASSDEVYITVIGKGGHAARVEELKNPLLIAAEILLELRMFTDLQRPSVLSFGKMEGAGSTNIVPDRVSLAGTLRCFDEAWRRQTKNHIENICHEITDKYLTGCEVHFREGAPVLVNDPALTSTAMRLAAAYSGSGQVLQLPYRMGSEDFAHYTHHVPGLFYRIGTGNKKKGITAGLHTPDFDVDETCLLHSPGLMAWLACNL
ncbi:MAG: M20 family metallopeptidase [Chitinophagales bacterium]|nr:M20 family metallopeptidase [Chitinophagales bacterium]MDW8418268.1 M20 family metallopeptidase [Chitinophagales bacterium]